MLPSVCSQQNKDAGLLQKDIYSQWITQDLKPFVCLSIWSYFGFNNDWCRKIFEWLCANGIFFQLKKKEYMSV